MDSAEKSACGKWKFHKLSLIGVQRMVGGEMMGWQSRLKTLAAMTKVSWMEEHRFEIKFRRRSMSSRVMGVPSSWERIEATRRKVPSLQSGYMLTTPLSIISLGRNFMKSFDLSSVFPMSAFLGDNHANERQFKDLCRLNKSYGRGKSDCFRLLSNVGKKEFFRMFSEACEMIASEVFKWM